MNSRSKKSMTKRTKVIIGVLIGLILGIAIGLALDSLIIFLIVGVVIGAGTGMIIEFDPQKKTHPEDTIFK